MISVKYIELRQFVGSCFEAVFVSILLSILGLYIAVGLFVGIAFVLRGVNLVDAVAGGSPFIFRVVILPGCVGLWPVVLWKWIKSGKGAPA